MTGRAARFVVCVLLSVLASSESAAVPRYSIQYDQGCALCHSNPTGGGQRSLFGAQFFSYSDLAMKTLGFDELETVNPQITDQLQVGFDARTLYSASDRPRANTFFEMQGDLYLQFQLDERWRLLLDKGLYDNFELMAIGHVLAQTGYVKIGHFVPPFGMRQTDHTAFVRERVGYGTGFRETGIEIGFHPERINAAFSVTNGSSAAIDEDEEKAITGRVDVRRRLGSVSTWLGATGRWNERPDDLDAARSAGGYGGIRLGAVSLLGEVIFKRVERDMVATFAELAVVATQGVTLRLEHQFFDPDEDVELGAENKVAVGFEVVPTGFMQVIGGVGVIDPTDDDGKRRTEGNLLLHIFY